MAEYNNQSRKWLITINNPIDYGFTHEKIVEFVTSLKSMIYYCLSDEIGEKGTYHTHIFIASSSGIRFSTIQKLFRTIRVNKITKEIEYEPDGVTNKWSYPDIQLAKGTSQENRDYIFKSGKWENSKKSETNLKETHLEHGDIPVERQGKRNDIDDLYDMIRSGLSNFEIIESNPEYLLIVDKIERARQIIKEEEYRDKFRKLEVTYICGKEGTGKSRYAMEKYGYSNVYRITDHKNPWDGYRGQDVIVFEDFFSSDFKLSDMLNYLDGYPLELPCRYANKIACFTKVYITSNLNLNEQYTNIQEEYPTSWKAFLRRIHFIDIFLDTNDIRHFKLINNDFIPIINDSFIEEQLSMDI